MAVNHWPNIDWEQERGVCTIEYNISLVLARAGVEEVAQAMTEDYPTRLWERDILSRPVFLM